MVEISSCIELKAKPDETTENLDTEQNNISFEEFLAQEKKDAFWYGSFLKEVNLTPLFEYVSPSYLDYSFYQKYPCCAFKYLMLRFTWVKT